MDAWFCCECGTDTFKSNEIKPAKPSFFNTTAFMWCACGFSICYCVFAAFSEPRYHGKTLSEWLERHHQSPEAARNAIRRIGPAAVPWLVSWIDDSQNHASWRETLQTALQKIPFHVFEKKSPPSSDSVEFAFSVLGSRGSKAVPALTKLAQGTNYLSARGAIAAMGYIGKPALPCLLSLITNDSPLRGNAIAALGRMDSENTPVIAPLLIGYLQDTNPTIRITAATALYRITPDHGAIVHAMTNCLWNETDVNLRCQAIFILARFGDRVSAIQELLKATLDSSVEVRETATNALRYLAPGVLGDLNLK